VSSEYAYFAALNGGTVVLQGKSRARNLFEASIDNCQPHRRLGRPVSPAPIVGLLFDSSREVGRSTNVPVDLMSRLTSGTILDIVVRAAIPNSRNTRDAGHLAAGPKAA
jgi:hypothetical protein